MLPRAGALAVTIRAYLVSGDVIPAVEHEIAAAVAFIHTSDNVLSTVSSMTLLAHLHVLQGRLRQAAAAYAQVVPRPEVVQTMFGSLFYYFGLGDLLHECNDLDAAERHLAKGMAQVKETLTLEPLVAVLGYTALARLHQARGNTREAFATLDELAHLAQQRHFTAHLVAQEAAVRVRLELTQGNLTPAIRWADSSGLSTEDDDLRYPREGEYLALARVRIAQGRDDQTASFLQEALHLLDRLLQDAEAKARMGSVLEILVLRALALEAQGDRTNALSTLERALVLAAPEGYIRLFVDEGSPMLALLRQAHARSSVPGYVATLLSVFGEQQTWRGQAPPLLYPVGSEFSSLLVAGFAPAMQLSARLGPLVEPLTERERDVLRLLLVGASTREIARRLALSVNTVKRHVYNICGKLGVQSRTQAIICSRALNLL